MHPKSVTELVILKLVFVPPNTEIRDPVLVEHCKSHKISCRTQPLRAWYFNAMSKEYENIPKDNTVEFCLWRIKTHNAELFTINNIRYDNLVLFVGQENIYWHYFTLEPTYRSTKGVTPLTICYCSCCFDTQFLRFIESIHENLEATGYIVS